MKPRPEHDADLIADILDAVVDIQREAPSKSTFDSSELVQAFVILRIMRIGECANLVTTETMDRHPGIPWRQLIGTRNRLAHDYWGVNPDVVWRIVDRHVPALIEPLRSVLRDLEEN